MASLGILYPTSIEGTTGGTWTNQDVNRVNKGIDTPDGLAITSGVNSTSTISFGFNLPNNILHMSGVTVRLRVRVSSLVDDTQSMFVRFQSLNGTNLTDEFTVLQRTSSIGYANYTINMGTYLNSASHHLWNYARLVIRTQHSANMGNDGSFWDIDEIELTGTYRMLPSITTLTAPTAGQTGVASGRTVFQFTQTAEPGNPFESFIEIDTTASFDSISGSVIADYPFSNLDAAYSLFTGGGLAMVGQSFRGSAASITRARVAISRFGSPTGLVELSIRTHSGPFGSATPTTTILGTSLPVDVRTLPQTGMAITEFTFPSSISISSGTNYFLVVQFISQFSNSENSVRLGVDNSSPTHEGNVAVNSGSWSVGGPDLVFDIETNRAPFIRENSNPGLENGFSAGTWTTGQSQTYTVPVGSELAPNTTYFWRVRSRYTVGDNMFGLYQLYSFTTSSTGGFTGGTLKRWNGSSWVNAKLRRWNGSAFENKVLKRWNGSSWVSINTN